MSADDITRNRQASLVEVLDRIIDTGVVIQGDATISLADVNLIYLGLKLVLCSSDRLGNPMMTTISVPVEPPPDTKPTPTATPMLVAGSQNENALPTGDTGTQPSPLDVGPHPERGLAQLVLTLVELLRQLMERQAIHRMERGTVSDEQITRMSQTLWQIKVCMDDLKRYFDLRDDDLNLDLGPLGSLVD